MFKLASTSNKFQFVLLFVTYLWIQCQLTRMRDTDTLYAFTWGVVAWFFVLASVVTIWVVTNTT